MALAGRKSRPTTETAGPRLVKLETRASSHSADAWDILKTYLDLAEKGDVVGVAVAALYPDGSIGTAVSTTDNAIALLGGVTIMQDRLLKRFTPRIK